MKTEQLITFLISPEQTIVEAMQKIDANAKGILFITNTDRKLIGAITDGDIRRWLIKTGNLQEQISRLMNRNPKSVYRREVASAQDVMRRYSITALPVLNSKGIVIDILFEQEQKTEVREGINIYRNLRYYNGRGKEVSKWMNEIDGLRKQIEKTNTINERSKLNAGNGRRGENPAGLQAGL